MNKYENGNSENGRVKIVIDIPITWIEYKIIGLLHGIIIAIVCIVL